MLSSGFIFFFLYIKKEFLEIFRCGCFCLLDWSWKLEPFSSTGAEVYGFRRERSTGAYDEQATHAPRSLGWTRSPRWTLSYLEPTLCCCLFAFRVDLPGILFPSGGRRFEEGSGGEFETRWRSGMNHGIAQFESEFSLFLCDSDLFLIFGDLLMLWNMLEGLKKWCLRYIKIFDLFL